MMRMSNKTLKKYIFTFGSSHILEGNAQVVEAKDEEEARTFMNSYYGPYWSMVYTQEQWEKFENDKNRMYPLEKLLPNILKEIKL
jgi:hypothetical protein